MQPSSARDRLKPFLLDRLTDQGATLRPGSSGAGELVLSPREYRDSVLRDLQWLLNSLCQPEAVDIDGFPNVASSVLNYGIPDLSRLVLGGATRTQLERWVTRAIERFEPRILPGTLSVRVASEDAESRPGSLQLEIQGEVWTLPEPEPVYLRTEIDLGTGGCRLMDH